MKEQKLYHVTEQAHLESIAQDGLRIGTCLCREDLVDYYWREMQSPVVLLTSVKMTDFEDAFMPDGPSLEEPVTTYLGLDENEVFEAWEDSSGTAWDCLEIAGAVKSRNGIPADELIVNMSSGAVSLEEYVSKFNVIQQEENISPDMS